MTYSRWARRRSGRVRGMGATSSGMRKTHNESVARRMAHLLARVDGTHFRNKRWS